MNPTKARKVKKCMCQLGRYWHSTSELCDFRYPQDVDGLGDLFPLMFYKFCPNCGKDLKEDIKKIWGNYKYQPPKLTKRLKQLPPSGNVRKGRKGK